MTPAMVVIVVEVPVLDAPSVAVMVVAVAATVWVVKATVATPLATVEVALAKEPLALDLLQVMTAPLALRLLLLIS